jgi:hypothetical protein
VKKRKNKGTVRFSAASDSWRSSVILNLLKTICRNACGSYTDMRCHEASYAAAIYSIASSLDYSAMPSSAGCTFASLGASVPKRAIGIITS